MNAQEIFDKVVAHLRQQNCKSQVEIYRYDNTLRLSCRYRGPNGLKCAVGCLIEDYEYQKSWEGSKVVAIPILRFREHIKLLNDLQNVHDNKLIGHWESNFQRIAQDFNLQYSPKEIA